MAGEKVGDVLRPLLLAVDADPRKLDRIEGEPQRSFGSDFRIRGEPSSAAARQVLTAAHEVGRRVAVVLVDGSLPGSERAAVSTRRGRPISMRDGHC